MCDVCISEKREQLEATSEGEDTDSIASGRSVEAEQLERLPSLLSPKWRERSEAVEEEEEAEDDQPEAPAAVLQVSTSNNDEVQSRPTSSTASTEPPSSPTSSMRSRYIIIIIMFTFVLEICPI